MVLVVISMGTELGFKFKTGPKARDYKLWFCL